MYKGKCVILEPLAAPNGIEQTGFINTPRLPLLGQTDCPHTHWFSQYYCFKQEGCVRLYDNYTLIKYLQISL